MTDLEWHYVDPVTGTASLESATLDFLATLLSKHDELSIWCEQHGEDWIIVNTKEEIDALRSTTNTDSLPEGWEAHIDEESGDTYYSNGIITTWELSDTIESTVLEEPPERPEPQPEPNPAAPQSQPSTSLPLPATTSETKTLEHVSSTNQIRSIQKHASKLAMEIKKQAISSGILYKKESNTFGGTTITKLAYSGPFRDIYDHRTLPDNTEWLNILRNLRTNKQQFQDTNFPANETSIWKDSINKTTSPHFNQCSEAVQWRRIKDILHQTVYVKISFAKMSKKQTNHAAPKIAGFAIVTEDVYNQDKENVDSFSLTNPNDDAYFNQETYIETAKLGSKHGLNLNQKELSSMCTDFVSNWLNESEPIGEMEDTLSETDSPTNFHTFWSSILTVCEPCHFKNYGKVLLWEEPAKNETVLPFVRCIIPLNFAPLRIQLFERDSPTRPLVAPGDVRQGILGDCYYLGALSVVSTHPTMLFDLFPDIADDLIIKTQEVDGTPQNEQEANEEGLYAVRFWREGKWRIVIVDDYIPCNAAGRPCFAQLPEHGCEIWVLIAEKAFAKLNGSYESIVAGQENEALADITGGLPQDYKLRGNDATDGFDAEQLWNELINHTNANETNLVCASCFNANNGIMSGHAYGVVDLQEITMKIGNDNEKEKMVKIRNPWGKGEEWNGDYNDNDISSWSNVAEAEKIKMGFQLLEKKQDDGAWWMTMKDFFLHYDVVNVCRLLRQPHWTGHHSNGEWYGEALPGGQTSYRNSQYQLIVHEDSTVFVNVGRPSSRARNLTYTFGTGPLVEYCPDTMVDGVNVSPVRLGKRIYNVGLTKHRIAAKLEVDRECCVQFNVKASRRPYLIVPITQNVGDTGLFFLSVFTSGKSEFVAIEDGKSGYLYESKVEQTITQDRSGGCFPNCEHWFKNPQYIFQVKEKGEILFVLDNERDTLIPLGFAVFKAENDHLITCSSPGQHHKTSAIAPRSAVSEFMNLEIGKYVVVPFSFKKNVELDFCFSIFSDVECTPIVPVTLWNSHYTFSSSWIDGLSGGCVNNQKTWLTNPYFSFTVGENGVKDGEKEQEQKEKVNEEKISVTIEITQPRTQNYPIGIALFKGIHPMTKVASRIVGGKPWHQNTFVAELSSGDFTVFAQTFNSKMFGDFVIRILSNGKVVVHEDNISVGGVVAIGL